MRVLLVIDDLRLAGAQRVVAQEIRALHPAYVEFHVVALAPTREPGFEPELRKQNVEVSYVSGSGMRDPRRIAALCHIIERVKPDLVHTHLTYANVLGTPAARLAGRPVVASLHNVDVNQAARGALKRRLEGAVLRLWATRIVVVCAGSHRATTRNFGVPYERTVVVPNAVHPRTIELPHGFDRERQRRVLGVEPGEYLLCTVARLDESKGQRFLLQALANVRMRAPELRFRLLLVGSGPDRTKLGDTIARLGLADCVSLLGVRNDIAEIIVASDVFVLPSLNEGLSQAMLEAMSLNVPVIATDVGGTADVLRPGRTGWCVPPGQPVALAEAIQQALCDQRAAHAHARAARALVAQHFSFALHVARLQAVYACVGSAK